MLFAKMGNITTLEKICTFKGGTKRTIENKNKNKQTEQKKPTKKQLKHLPDTMEIMLCRYILAKLFLHMFMSFRAFSQIP